MAFSGYPDLSRHLGQKTRAGISCAAKKGRARRELAGGLGLSILQRNPLGEGELPKRLGEGTGRAHKEGRRVSKRRSGCLPSTG